jgi:hypothetical protein
MYPSRKMQISKSYNLWAEFESEFENEDVSKSCNFRDRDGRRLIHKTEIGLISTILGSK